MQKYKTGFLPEPKSNSYRSFEQHLQPLSHRICKGTLAQGAVDFRSFSVSRRNQGPTLSCVGHAVVKALEIQQARKVGVENVTPLSVLEVYYLARELMFPKQTGWDSGTFISHACDAARRFGVCPETDWPFDPNQVNVPPSWGAMQHSYLHRAAAFYQIESEGQARVIAVKDALSKGYPVVIGTDVGDNWQDYEAGQVIGVCPNPTDKHATVLIGDVGGKFVGENSWSDRWGDQGFYMMDPAVIASDQLYEAWVVTREV